MNKGILSLAMLVTALLASASPGIAQDNWSSYLIITQAAGTPFEGPGQAPDGAPNAFALHGFHHLVTTEEGAHSAQHKPLVVTRPMDGSSARFFEAFVNQEPLELVVKIYNGPQLMFEFELHDARIVALEPITVPAESTNSEPEERETVRFMYSRWTIRDVTAGSQYVWQLAGWPS